MFRPIALPDTEACNPLMNKVSILVYVIMTLGFFIRILVDHKMIDSLYFSHFTSNASTTMKVALVGEQPAMICLFACLLYTGFSIAALKEGGKISRVLFRVADAMIFSLLLGALVHLNDFLQVSLMCGLYLTFQLEMLDVAYLEVPASKLRKTGLVILSGSFWLAYFLGMALNGSFSRPGGLVAQVFCSSIFVHDMYRLYRVIRRNEAFPEDNVLLNLVLRFVLLVCVFVETV